MTKQKFRAFSFVHVQKEMPKHMSHFESGFDAIVEYTYRQQYGYGDYKSYSVYVLKDGKIVNTIAWYDESQLTQINEKYSHVKATDLIEAYMNEGGE
jgi:hypothetical protein